MGFTDVRRTAVDSAQGPIVPASGTRPFGVWFHGAGGNEGTYGDKYEAQCPVDMGGADVPLQVWRLKRADAQGAAGVMANVREPSGTRYAFYTGWRRTTAGTSEPIYPYVERRMEAIIAHALALYPWLDPDKVYLGGNSMGGCGTLSFGLRRPQTFCFLRAAAARWTAEGVCCWDSNGYKYFADEGGNPPAAEPAVLEGGADYRAYYNMRDYVANPANEIPFLIVGFGSSDQNEGMAASAQALAFAAMRAGNRGFAACWEDGDHSVASFALNKLTTYTIGMFKRGAGYPILSQHSNDDDPLVDVAGFINGGFEWRNVIESASAWSCEIRNTQYANGTATVIPYSKSFANRPSRSITYTQNVWQTVQFTASDPVEVPPVIAYFTCDGLQPDAKGGSIAAAPGQTLTLSWSVDGERVAVNGVDQALIGSTQWTAPTEPGSVMLFLNAYRGALEAPVQIFVTVQSNAPTIEQRVAALEAWGRTIGFPG